MKSVSEQAVRRTIVGVAAAVSVWLLTAALHTFVTSREVAQVTIAGQAESEFFAALRSRCGHRGRARLELDAATERAELQSCADAFLAEHRADGLRYVSITLRGPRPERPFGPPPGAAPFDPSRGPPMGPPGWPGPPPPPAGSAEERPDAAGDVFVEAGQRTSPRTMEADPRMRGRPVRLGERYVYIMPPPGGPHVREPSHVMEFEPTRAQALARSGTSALVSGLLGVVVTFGGALLMLRLARQREEAQREAREQQQLAILGRMAAVMAHELRNPLASAKGHAQLLAEVLEGSARAYGRAQFVVKELLRVEMLTNDLLGFVRSGRVQRRPCDPRELAHEASRRVSTPAPIEVQDRDAPATWSLDPHAMERVLTNLLRNAAQAQGDATDPITLLVSQRDGALFFSVRDHGPGFATDVDVFAPFVTTKATGTGLGLTVSRQIVQAHGGRIVALTHPEGGAVVEVYIPPAAPSAV